MPITQVLRRAGLFAVATVVLVAGAPGIDQAVQAQLSASGVKAGVLRCEVESGWGLIFGSSKEIKCLYSPYNGKTVERYVGTIEKYGVDIGYSQSAVILWAVVAATKDLDYGALAGRYMGATAEASVGFGVGVNVLFASNKSFVLQPVSISGQQGLNVAGGIGLVTLKAAKQ